MLPASSLPDSSYFIFKHLSECYRQVSQLILEQKLKGKFEVVRFDWHGILKLQHPKDFDKLFWFYILGIHQALGVPSFLPTPFMFLGTCEQFKLNKLKMMSQLIASYLS